MTLRSSEGNQASFSIGRTQRRTTAVTRPIQSPKALSMALTSPMPPSVQDPRSQSEKPSRDPGHQHGRHQIAQSLQGLPLLLLAPLIVFIEAVQKLILLLQSQVAKFIDRHIRGVVRPRILARRQKTRQQAREPVPSQRAEVTNYKEDGRRHNSRQYAEGDEDDGQP